MLIIDFAEFEMPQSCNLISINLSNRDETLLNVSPGPITVPSVPAGRADEEFPESCVQQYEQIFPKLLKVAERDGDDSIQDCMKSLISISQQGLKKIENSFKLPLCDSDGEIDEELIAPRIKVSDSQKKICSRRTVSADRNDQSVTMVNCPSNLLKVTFENLALMIIVDKYYSQVMTFVSKVRADVMPWLIKLHQKLQRRHSKRFFSVTDAYLYLKYDLRKESVESNLFDKTANTETFIDAVSDLYEKFCCDDSLTSIIGRCSNKNTIYAWRNKNCHVFVQKNIPVDTNPLIDTEQLQWLFKQLKLNFEDFQ